MAMRVNGQHGPERRENEAETWRNAAKEILKSVPQPSIPVLPRAQVSDFSKYKNRPNMSPAEAWQKCADAIEQHDGDACKAHREEIDTLLVFAGLFSAVLTAFAIESYQWLQDDPNDAIISLLSQLVEASGSIRTAPLAKASGLPAAVSVRINAYWFLSLTLSLSAALVAILCKQWVREFERHADESHSQYISIRQMKLEGFDGWGVASIVTVIPLLLQSALGLFALGLIELLWDLHLAVAIVVLVPTVAALLFYGLTTLVPGLQYMSSPFGKRRGLSQCPFKSPQSMLALRMLVILSEHWKALRKALRKSLQAFLRIQGTSRVSSQQDPPTLELLPQDLETWITLDRAFNRARDLCYSKSDYIADLKRSSYGVKIPSPSCFRALKWLEDHIDQPGVRSRICLAVLDIASGSITGQGLPLPVWGMRHGIFSLAVDRFSIREDDGEDRLGPLVDVLNALGSYDFGPAFLSELLIQHFSVIDPGDSDFSRYIRYLDEESKHSLLHFILDRQLRMGTSLSARAPWITLFLFPDNSRPWRLSPDELSCTLALSFYSLHDRWERGEEREREVKFLQEIFDAGLSLSGEEGSTEVETALRALDALVPRLGPIVARGPTNNHTLSRGSSAVASLFKQTVALLTRIHGEIHVREEEARRPESIPTGPSVHPSNLSPRGNRAHTAIDIHTDPTVPVQAVTAAARSDNALGPIPDQSGQDTVDNPSGVSTLGCIPHSIDNMDTPFIQ